MRVKPLITHTVSYARGPEIYEMIRNKSQEFMGVTFDWRGTQS